MDDIDKLARIIKIVEINRYISKGTRRWMLRWMRKVEKEMKILYSDIKTIKRILIAMNKKIKLDVELDENEDDDDAVIEYQRKPEEDLFQTKPKLDPMERSYFI